MYITSYSVSNSENIVVRKIIFQKFTLADLKTWTQILLIVKYTGLQYPLSNGIYILFGFIIRLTEKKYDYI